MGNQASSDVPEKFVSIADSREGRTGRVPQLGRPPAWFVLSLLAVLAVALGIRMAVVAAVSQPSEPGFLVDYDPIFYHREANLVADGRGFISPYRLDDAGHGMVTPSAGHPPLLPATG